MKYNLSEVIVFVLHRLVNHVVLHLHDPSTFKLKNKASLRLQTPQSRPKQLK